MWKIVICDDEQEAGQLIKDKIKAMHIEEVSDIELYHDGHDLISDFEYGNIDTAILVMDIKLGELNGIHLAEKILQMKPACQIIFVSGYDDYYEDVYDVEHVYFVQKPLNDFKLQKALHKAMERLVKIKKECFCISNKSGNYVIPFEEIYSFEKNRRKIIVKSAEGEVCSFYGTFAELEGQLKNSFVRCHHSFFVNMDKIRVMEGENFLLRNGERIPISRTYFKDAKMRFIKYIDRH